MRLTIDGLLAEYNHDLGWVCSDDVIRVQLQLYTTLAAQYGTWEPIPKDIDQDIMDKVTLKMESLGYKVTQSPETEYNLPEQ